MESERKCTHKLLVLIRFISIEPIIVRLIFVILYRADVNTCHINGVVGIKGVSFADTADHIFIGFGIVQKDFETVGWIVSPRKLLLFVHLPTYLKEIVSVCILIVNKSANVNRM